MRAQAVAKLALALPKQAKHGSRKGRARQLYLHDVVWEGLEKFCASQGQEPDSLSISRYLNTSAMLDLGIPVVPAPEEKKGR